MKLRHRIAYIRNIDPPHGFTLVELLVVITIIGVLIALLLPAIQAAREAARKAQCSNNLKQIDLAVFQYQEMHGSFPQGDGSLNLPSGGLPFSWSARILPYVEQQGVFDTIKFSDGFNQNLEPNKTAIKQFLPYYQCPSAEPLMLSTCCINIPHESDAAEMDYAAVATDANAPGASTTAGTGVMFSDSHVRLDDVSDGTSQTLAVAERIPFPETDPWRTTNAAYCPGNKCEFGVIWAAWSVVTTFFGINSEAGMTYYQSGVESAHPGGANFAFVDGHVAFLSENMSGDVTDKNGVDKSILRALTTRDGGELIGGNEY
jgi:prepilin-type N-terminal cleavage/methylation domain-containing protein/prepilin-type processing-associated H-X9-DG protein